MHFTLKGPQIPLDPTRCRSGVHSSEKQLIPYACFFASQGTSFGRESLKSCALTTDSSTYVTDFSFPHRMGVFFPFSLSFFLFSFLLQTWCWSVGGCFARGFLVCLALGGLDSVFSRKTFYISWQVAIIWCFVLFLFHFFFCQTSFKGKPSPRSWVSKHVLKPPTTNRLYRQQLS